MGLEAELHVRLTNTLLILGYNILGYSAAAVRTLCTQREDGNVNVVIASSYSRSALGKAPSTEPASRPVAFHADKFQ